MAQGRRAIFDLLDGKASWPPVVVPFGLDPFGWHGERDSYRELCDFALGNCTLLPKVYPFGEPLAIGQGDITISCDTHREADGTVVKKHSLVGGKRELTMEEVQTPGDSSWKIRSRWIETDDDLDVFLKIGELPPSEPDIQAVRDKERQVGVYGLPYAETPDPFYTVCEMFRTDHFYISLLMDCERIERLIESTSRRILYGIEKLCREAACPFILRLIGAEMAAPPFMSKDDFLKFEGPFYREVIEITKRYGIPASFHSHGPVRDTMSIIWDMGYAFVEPFEPPPNGNVTIAEALAAAKGKGIVFGGVDDVVINTCDSKTVEKAVKRCLDDARGTNCPYILSQSSTPFSDPLSPESRDNYLLFMKLGTEG